MKATNRPINPITHWLRPAFAIGALVGLAALTGCLGYVDGGYGGPVYVPGPDVYFYTGYYERGRDVHEYSHRGHESHAAVHHDSGGHGGKAVNRRTH